MVPEGDSWRHLRVSVGSVENIVQDQTEVTAFGRVEEVRGWLKYAERYVGLRLER